MLCWYSYRFIHNDRRSVLDSLEMSSFYPFVILSKKQQRVLKKMIHSDVVFDCLDHDSFEKIYIEDVNPIG